MLFALLITFLDLSCVPDPIQTADQVEVGIAEMYDVYDRSYTDSLFCTRIIKNGDTTYWEWGCVSNRLTPDPHDSKDTFYITQPWPFKRFIPWPKAVQYFERCGVKRPR